MVENNYTFDSIGVGAQIASDAICMYDPVAVNDGLMLQTQNNFYLNWLPL